MNTYLIENSDGTENIINADDKEMLFKVLKDSKHPKKINKIFKEVRYFELIYEKGQI